MMSTKLRFYNAYWQYGINRRKIVL